MTRAHAIVAAYALLAILVVPVFPHFLSPNEFSHWVITVAIVDYHTVEATPVIRDTRTRMEDLATINGHLYSNKAPGSSFLVVPAYLIVRAFAGPPSPENLRTTLNAMRLLGSTLPAVLVALWVGAVARRFGCAEDRIAVATAALLFGTPLFAYGLLFFAHALSAFTLFGAWALLFASRDSRFETRDPYLAGALIGLAVLSEYPSAVPAAVLIACALPRLRSGGTLRVIAGGVPFALALGTYNQLAFGRVFTLSSAHEVDANIRELAHSGIFGVGLPSPEYLLKLLGDPSKGLFVLSPVLLIVFLGLRRAWPALPRAAFVSLVATPLSILLLFAGYPNWFGGWTVGARYLVAAAPFLALLIAFAASTVVETILLGASIGVIAVLSLVFPFIPPDYRAPWISFSWPILRDGFVAPNLLHFVSRPLAVAVPFAIALIVLVIAVRRRIALAVLGIVLWFAAGLATETSRPAPPFIRALVEQVHFGKQDAIARDVPPGRERATLEAIAQPMQRVPPTKWPF